MKKQKKAKETEREIKKGQLMLTCDNRKKDVNRGIKKGLATHMRARHFNEKIHIYLCGHGIIRGKFDLMQGSHRRMV